MIFKLPCRRFPAYTVVLVASLALAQHPKAFAQIARTNTSFGAATLGMRKSFTGGQIEARFADPFLSTRKIERIASFLRREYQFDWGKSTTLRDIERDVAQHLPIEINVRALEEIGLSADETVNIAAHAARTSSRGEDVADSNASGPSSHRWWQGDVADDDTWAERSNAAKLLGALDQLDLTLNVTSGRLVITTWEDAEEHCCVRLYDVTPLVDFRDQALMNDSAKTAEAAFLGQARVDSFHDYQSLIDLIQTVVEPNTWEALGGPSTIAPYSTTNRCWIVVAVPLMHHWKVETLLNGLNE